MTTDRRQVCGGDSLDRAEHSVTYHDSTGTYRAEFDGTTRSASEATVSAVAVASDCDPLALPPLYASVDPDALDRLVTPTGNGTRRPTTSISFEYADNEVAVNGHGTVEVSPIVDPRA